MHGRVDNSHHGFIDYLGIPMKKKGETKTSRRRHRYFSYGITNGDELFY